MKPLLEYKVADEKDLGQCIHAAAVEVERALILGGAIPGRDYKLLDLYQLAAPYALKAVHPDGLVLAWGIGDRPDT